MEKNNQAIEKISKYLGKLSSDEVINLGWSLNNEVGLLLRELEYLDKLKEDIASDLAAISEREAGINVIKKYINSYNKSK